MININNKKQNNQDGYILAFTLILMSILLTVSLSISKIILREINYSRLVDSSKGAYFAADSGIECAQYLDSSFMDDTRGVSIILNSSDTNGQNDFSVNAMNNVFFSTSTVFNSHPDFLNLDINGIKSKIVCASDDGSYNQIFNDSVTPYATSKENVKDNLMNLKSSYFIEGDSSHATTTFGIIIKQTDSNNPSKIINRCALVEFMKVKGTATDTTSYFSISSTGYSNCENSNLSKISRTIYRYSTD